MARNIVHLFSSDRLGCNYDFGEFPREWHFFVRIGPMAKNYIHIGAKYPWRPVLIVRVFGRGVTWIKSIPGKYASSDLKINGVPWREHKASVDDSPSLQNALKHLRARDAR